ncbi:hypothetical protein PG991_010242 [Apiospora marii]|uniref:DUF6546 domain-containing protein n=1 Tax=Apiospora marii TaxID=335849 RepID=A0ABR1RHV7_9PEZI
MAANNSLFGRLPMHLRCRIMEMVAQSLPSTSSLSPFTTVSHEWQVYLEQFTFERIRVTPERLDSFKSYMNVRRQGYVRYIWLCMELEAYDCRTCAPEDPEDYIVSDADNLLIKNTFESLFAALSTWYPKGSLVLDISAHSPSDSEHWFDYLTFRPDAPMDRSAEEEIEFGLRKQKHPIFLGNKLAHPAERIMNRVFETIMSEGPFETDAEEDQWWQDLPSVPAVTGILLRQQNRRRWKPKALARMLTRFPQLEEIHYEPWREWDRGDQKATDLAYETLLGSLGGSTHPKLRKVALFENFDDQYAFCLVSAEPRSVTLNCEPVRTPRPGLSHTLASSSLSLEHLSASFVVEASRFLRGLKPSWAWPNLTSLVLTSQLLTAQPERQADIDALLQSAAAAAMRMPKLETMEIWNGSAGLAGTFQYRRSAPPSITWRGTWAHPFPVPVVRAWQAVVDRHGSGGTDTEEFVVVSETLNKRLVMKSHGDAIHYLKVSPSVIRPVSLQQIRLKDRVRKEGLAILAWAGDYERRNGIQS